MPTIEFTKECIQALYEKLKKEVYLSREKMYATMRNNGLNHATNHELAGLLRRNSSHENEEYCMGNIRLFRQQGYGKNAVFSLFKYKPISSEEADSLWNWFLMKCFLNP